jgi:UDP-N-acetylglucosamine 2-epimerase (non-hydrolysing)
MASTVLSIIGTRPEAIKMSPVLRLLDSIQSINSLVCATGQQESLLPQTLDHLCIDADFSLDCSAEHRLLSEFADAPNPIESVLTECAPDLVLVQGDTTSALAGALAASYQDIAIGHVEAGLRTGNLLAPFPEEINRQFISRISKYHFATTSAARQNLLNEGILQDNIWLIGSTVIDALQFALNRIEQEPQSAWMETISDELLRRICDERRPLVLITGHRRENLNSGIASVCKSLLDLAARRSDCDFVFPVHPNPGVRKQVFSVLDETENVFLTRPMNYTEFVFVMASSCLIITDSGGIQEEAPFLNVPLLVTRDCTERIEGVNAGIASIVGSHPTELADMAEHIICATRPHPGFGRHRELYGDGHASMRLKDVIVDLLQNEMDAGIAI